MIILVALGLVAMGFVYLVIRFSVTEPLRRMKLVAEPLAVGDTDVESVLPRASRDEIGAVGASFRAIVARQQV